jgi:hypothetical protein
LYVEAAVVTANPVKPLKTPTKLRDNLVASNKLEMLSNAKIKTINNLFAANFMETNTTANITTAAATAIMLRLVTPTL